jgi:hypothetical protein
MYKIKIVAAIKYLYVHQSLIFYKEYQSHAKVFNHF